MRLFDRFRRKPQATQTQVRRQIGLPPQFTDGPVVTGLRRPYTPYNEAELAKSLYDRNAFLKYMIDTTIFTAVGRNQVEVVWSNPAQGELFEMWKPLRESRTAGWRTVVRNLLREIFLTGDGFIQLLGDDTLQVLESQFFRVPPAGQGVVLGPDNRPVEYIYSPFTPQFAGYLPTHNERIPAEAMIHIYDKARTRSFRGVSWVRASLEHIMALEGFSREQIRAVTNQMRTSDVLMFSNEMIKASLPDESETDDENVVDALKYVSGTFMSRFRAGAYEGTAAPKDGVEVLHVENAEVNDRLAESVYRQHAVQAAEGFGLSESFLTGRDANGGYSGNASDYLHDLMFFDEVRNLVDDIVMELAAYFNPVGRVKEIVWQPYAPLNPLHASVMYARDLELGAISMEAYRKLRRLEGLEQGVIESREDRRN